MEKQLCFPAIATLVFGLNACAADTGNAPSSLVYQADENGPSGDIGKTGGITGR